MVSSVGMRGIKAMVGGGGRVESMMLIKKEKKNKK